MKRSDRMYDGYSIPFIISVFDCICSIIMRLVVDRLIRGFLYVRMITIFNPIFYEGLFTRDDGCAVSTVFLCFECCFPFDSCQCSFELYLTRLLWLLLYHSS
jgi:hypothetical protein